MEEAERKQQQKIEMDLQAPLSNLSATQKDQLMSEVKQQIAVANAQELVTVSSINQIEIFNRSD